MLMMAKTDDKYNADDHGDDDGNNSEDDDDNADEQSEDSPKIHAQLPRSLRKAHQCVADSCEPSKTCLARSLAPDSQVRHKLAHRPRARDWHAMHNAAEHTNGRGAAQQKPCLVLGNARGKQRTHTRQKNGHALAGGKKAVVPTPSLLRRKLWPQFWDRLAAPIFSPPARGQQPHGQPCEPRPARAAALARSLDRIELAATEDYRNRNRCINSTWPSAAVRLAPRPALEPWRQHAPTRGAATSDSQGP